MPVQIGAKSHSFSDPTGLLSDCHRRIEMFLGTLVAVSQVINHPPTDEVRHSLELALLYFREAAPKHTADEEVSLFPRLRMIESAEIQSAFAELDRLEEEHRTAEHLHALVDQLGMTYLQVGNLPEGDIVRFRESVAQLEELYRGHIDVEDRRVFPVAEKSLSPAAKREVAGEMASRRNLSPALIQPK